LTLEEQDVQEEFFERGWTDGLPIVPPTVERVQRMLAAVGADEPQLLIGFLPQRGVGVTLEKAAINAVLAGCRPEYFPIVVAALEAAFDPEFNLHAMLTSTSGTAQCIVVSGSLTEDIGMNSEHNVLGGGNRANATIGRAFRLVARNVLGAIPGAGDATSIGHPGKLSFCFAERRPPQPWRPLRVELGYREDDTTVTVVASEGPRQIGQMLTRDVEDVLRTCASAIKCPAWIATGRRGAGVLILGPEHAGFCVDAGWTQAQVRQFVCSESRISLDELRAAGVSTDGLVPAADGRLDSLASPDHLVIVTAGGEGAGWSSWVPQLSPSSLGVRMTTRRVRPTGEPLPDCGPDGCIVPWDAS
jgi:hypothetical protein